jgi:hypothetical protein
MSDFWLPPNNPFTHPLYGALPNWRFPKTHRHFIYQFFLNNIDKFGQSDPKPEAETLSGQKRKAIKLEEEVEEPCTHLVWHKSYPYCSICIDLSIVKKEDIDE